MKKNTILILFCLGFSCFSASQTKGNFSYTDTTFTVGQTRKIFVKYVLDKAKLLPESMPSIDSLYEFLEKNKNIKVVINVHSDSRPNRSCSKPTQNRAQSIADTLVKRGIDIGRIVAQGWGDRKLLVNEETIKKAKSKEEREVLHALNRRTEIKIYEIEEKK